MSHEDEVSLLSKMLEEADIKSAIRQKVTPQFFIDVGNREIYHWLLGRFQKYGKLPSLRLLEREFPDFEPIESEEDLPELIEEVRRAKLYADLSEGIKQVVQATKEDPSDGYAQLREMAGRLTLTHSNTEDTDVTKVTGEMFDEYNQIRGGEKVRGIPYPWEYCNTVTLGMHPGELIGIYARPKSMKTWVALCIANHVHETTGKVPVFFSGEMPVPQIRKRLTALRARVPYAAYRSGQLTPKQVWKLKKALLDLKSGPPFMICKVEGMGESAITEIRAKCDEYQADLAVCDGAYFWMEDDTYRSFRVITRGLKKNVAEALNIPAVMITQANRSSEKERGKGTTSGVAFGDSLAQDCDQLLHIIREQQHHEMKELLITMPAMREAEGGTFTINAKPAEDFTQKHIFEDQREVLDETDEGSSILG